MVKASDGWKFDDIVGFGRSHGTTVRRVLLQTSMRLPRPVVLQIRRQMSLEMAFVENHNVVEKFSA
jgi:hypothetical protein